MDGAKRRQSPPQFIQRIGRLKTPLTAFASDDDLLAVRHQLPERLHRQKTVTPNLLAADHTLKQARLLAAIKQVKRRDRRQRVAKQPPIDGHKLMPVSQAAKGLEVG